MAEKDNKSLIVYDGAEIGKDYSLIWGLVDISGKLAYSAKKGSDSYVVYDGREYGPYEIVFRVKSVAGKLAYSAKKNGKWFVYYDGKEYGREYDYIGYRFVGNRFAATEGDCLIVANASMQDCVSYEENGTTSYYLITPAFEEVDGKLAYFAGVKDKTFIVYDGKEIGAQYSPVGPYITYDENGTERYISSVEGKLVYSASWGNYSYTVWGDKELGNGIRAIKEIDGKVAYIAAKSNKEVINFDGREIGSDYGHILNFQDVGGKLAYVALKDKRIICVVADQQIGSEYDSVLAVKMLGGKILYEATRNYTNFLVYEGKEKKEFDIGGDIIGDGLSGVFLIDGKLNMIKFSFSAQRGGEYYLLKEE